MAGVQNESNGGIDMTVYELVSQLPLKAVGGEKGLDKVVSSGYAGDLLSNVMGQAVSGGVWVTMQGHQNIIAVGDLVGLSAIIVAGGVEPDNEAVVKAEKEGMALLITTLPVFEIVGRLHQLGIKGT
jgi:predicted transcriptional regulator